MMYRFLPQALFVAAFIAAAAAVAFLAPAVAGMFTRDMRVIVAVTVVSVWAAEVGVFVWRSRFMLARRMRELAGASEQEAEVVRRGMVSRYLLAGSLFAGLLGYACYGVYRDITAKAAGESISGGLDGELLLKIGGTVLLLGVLMFIVKRNR